MKQHHSIYITAAVLAMLYRSAIAAAPSLGAADSFAVLGGSTVTNTGPSVITGNLGVSPGSAITGFPPGTVTNGAMYSGAGSLAGQAHADAFTAYNTLKGEAGGINLTGQNLGGLTLTPGVYRFSTSAQLTGTLFLNTQGDPNATFHFQIGSTLTTASSSAIITLGLGGIAGKNIFWQVGSSATLGTNSSFQGTILALSSITVTTGAGIRGRVLAINGAVTLDSNTISNLAGGSVILNSVLLEFLQGSFQSLSCLTPNQSSVAAALDTLSSHNPGSALIAALDTEKIQFLPGDYDLLTPVAFAAIFDAGFALEQEQSGNIERRLEEIRDGSTGANDPGLSATDSHGTFSDGGKDGKTMIDKNGKDISDPTIDRRWGFYISGFGESVDIGSTVDANCPNGQANITSGSDFSTGGGNVGIDYRLGDHVALGLTAGYANTTSDGVGDGKIDINNANATAYATWFDRGFYVNGIIGGGYNFYKTRRETIGGLASGDTEGTDFTALIGTGYEHHVGKLTVGPIAALQYTSVSIQGFTETGSLAPLRLNQQSESSLQSRIGARVSYALNVGHVVVTPEVRAQWQHEFQETSRDITSNFAADSTTSFTVHGPQIGRDSLLLDAGVSVQLNSRTSVFAYYTGDLGASNYTSHTISGGVRIKF